MVAAMTLKPYQIAIAKFIAAHQWLFIAFMYITFHFIFTDEERDEFNKSLKGKYKNEKYVL